MGRGGGAGGGAGGRSRAATAPMSQPTPPATPGAQTGKWQGDKFGASATEAARAVMAAPGPNTDRRDGGEAASPTVFGDRQVYISAAYDKAASQGYRGSLGDFKQALLSAQRSGTVNLARADMMNVMARGAVDRSETNVPGSSSTNPTRFHFIMV